MGRAATALFCVVVMSACAPDPAGRLFQTTATTPDGSNQLVIVLGDRTGLVLGIKPIEWVAPGGIEPATLTNAEGDANVLFFRWASGACDRPAISFSATGERFELRLDARPTLGMCTAILLHCAIRIDLIEQIPADHVDLVLPR
jgi:hypothetical protein